MGGIKENVAGITDVATYYLHQLTTTIQAGLSIKALVKIAAFIIQEAGKSDDRIGGPAQICIIRDTQPAQILKQSEIEEIKASVVDLSINKILVQQLEK